ncbi:hypothetical protein [Paenibacillus taichungensis]|uniref:hypothetical protein n=1 Tax=Paenibacillus taichungensis TaxID=484184 RepID=UPI002877A99D|nr:hypothetical protein [Paenibacillus taichungensis]
MIQISMYVMKDAPKQFVSRITPITTSAQQIFTAFAITILTAPRISPPSRTSRR